jgi:hypothetical protein
MSALKFVIVVFACKSNKYYITMFKTSDYTFSNFDSGDNEEFEEESINLVKKNEFTYKYPITTLIELIQTNELLDVDKITKKYMIKYNIQNVRGGTYNKIILTDWQLKSLNNEFETIKFDNETNINIDIIKDYDTLEKIDTQIKILEDIYTNMQNIKQTIEQTNFIYEVILDDIKFVMKITKDIEQNNMKIQKLQQEIQQGIQQEIQEKNQELYQKNQQLHQKNQELYQKNQQLQQNIHQIYQYSNPEIININNNYIKALKIISFNKIQNKKIQELENKYGQIQSIEQIIELLYMKQISLLS